MEAFDPAELPELLKLYYRRLFPYAQYYRWLNYGGGDGGGERVGSRSERGWEGVLGGYFGLSRCSAQALLSRALPTTTSEM